MTAAQKTTSTNVGPAVSPSKRTGASLKGESHTSPIRYAHTGVAQFSFQGFLCADVVYEKISADMRDCFTGSMPRISFLDTFYPVEGEIPDLPKIIFNVPLPCEDDPKTNQAYYTDRGTVSDFVRGHTYTSLTRETELLHSVELSTLAVSVLPSNLSTRRTCSST